MRSLTLPLLSVLLLAGASIQAQAPVRPGYTVVGDMVLPLEAVYGDATWNAPAWPGGIIPYDVRGATTQQEALFRAAMAELEGIANVTFVPWTGEPDYLVIAEWAPTNTSRAELGYIGGDQRIWVGQNHWTARFVLVHEMMHTLGFLHEQQRPDRQTFVDVQEQNVASRCGSTGDQPCIGNFDISNSATTVGPYDFQSIMHYSSTAFSIDGILQTIIAQPAFAGSEALMGNRSFMTILDAEGVASRYGAAIAPTITGLDRDGMTLGSGPVRVQIQGTRFYQGSPNATGVQGTRVFLDGAVVPATFIDPFTLEIELNYSQPGDLGCHDIQVSNSYPGGGNSNMVEFSVHERATGIRSQIGTQQGQRLGHAVAGGYDIDGDGVDDYVIGDPGYDEGRGRVRVFSGANSSLVWERVGFSEGSRLGTSIALGYFRGFRDRADVVAGEPGSASGRGTVRVFSAFGGGWNALSWPAPGGRIGTDVANLGDTDGNGSDDILIGAPGAASEDGEVRAYSASGIHFWTSASPFPNGNYGFSVSGGHDMDGDGIPDGLVGAPYSDFSVLNGGSAVLLSGATGLVIDHFHAAFDDRCFGWDVALVRGTNFRSTATAVVGSPNGDPEHFLATGPGRVYLYGSVDDLTYPLLDTWEGEVYGDAFGFTVAGAGDVDQDSAQDIYVGAPKWSSYPVSTQFVTPGQVYLISGVDGETLATSEGTQDGDGYGMAIADAGFCLDDGHRATLVGSPIYDGYCGFNDDFGRFEFQVHAIGPAQRKLMLTEVVYGGQRAVEITNVSDDWRSLRGWSVLWQEDGGPLFEAIMQPWLLEARTNIVVHQPGAVFAEIPVGNQTTFALPNAMGDGRGPLSVALVHPSGEIADEVRMTDTNGMGLGPALGGRWYGAVVRDPAHDAAGLSVDRVHGLDSQGGSDWTSGARRSLGLPSSMNGQRGYHTGNSSVRIDEIAAFPLVPMIELYAPTASTDLGGWSLVVSGDIGDDSQRIFPFDADSRITVTDRLVISNGGAPVEMPAGTAFISLAGLPQGLPLGVTPYSVALYDDYGRLVDLASSSGIATNVVHNHPRLPAHPEDFSGMVRRELGGHGSVGRVSVSVSELDSASSWATLYERRMGLDNATTLAGTRGEATEIDVVLEANPTTDIVSLIVNAGQAHANQTSVWMFSAGHLQGNGPFFGLGGGAPANYLATAGLYPFTGALDASGHFRFDTPPGLLPPGVAFDNRFIIIDSATSQVRALSPLITLDT